MFRFIFRGLPLDAATGGGDGGDFSYMRPFERGWRAPAFGVLALAAVSLWVAVFPEELRAETFIERTLDSALVKEVRQGGYVFYLRHGITDSSIPDEVPVDLSDCGTQRPLTAQGREQMALVGRTLVLLGWPVGELFCSPFCRAVESARAAFENQEPTVEPLLMYTAAMTSAEKAPVVARTRELIAQPLRTPGVNRVLVAHGPNLAEVMGYFPPEGSLVIFRPLDEGRFEYLATILPDQWASLNLHGGGRDGHRP